MAIIKINDAEVDELKEAGINELDEERAEEIVDEREENGPYADWEDLKQRVPGVSDGMVENLQQAGAEL